jgi:DNA-binding CsgD family transcriptional regulator
MAMKKPSKANPLSRLSRREYEVLEFVVAGRTSKEIAAILGLKPSSVFTYRSRIMSKLGIGEIASLVRFSIRHNLIKP